MTASQDIKTPTMNLPILETVSDDHLKTFCQSSTRLVLSQVLDDVHVFERLSPKTSETNYSRQKTYTVRLNLFPRSDYEAEYSIQPEQIIVGITKTFVPMLDKAILKEIKQNDKEIKSQAGDMGKGKKEKKRGGKSSGADEDGAGEADAGVVGRDDGEEIDGDADDERRQRQGDEEATYDEDEDDDKEDDAEEALEAKFKEDDEDRESSDEEDSDAESEDEEVVAKRSKAESLERIKQLERRVGESSRYINKLTFDKEKGEYCEFELEVSFSSFQLPVFHLLISSSLSRSSLHKPTNSFSSVSSKRFAETPSSTKFPGSLDASSPRLPTRMLPLNEPLSPRESTFAPYGTSETESSISTD